MSQVTGETSRTPRRSRAARVWRHVAWGTVVTVIAATVATTIGTTAAFAATKESTVTVVSSQNPSIVGQGVTFTATVTGSPGTPTGTVQFAIDGFPAGPAVALVGGVATSPVFAEADGLGFGIHQVDADYSGDAGFFPSTELVFQDVTANTTSVGVTSAPNPSLVGQAVTFNVTVAAASGNPSGVVYLLVDGSEIDSVTTSTGSVTFVASDLLAGAHMVDAVFFPDSSDFSDGQGSLAGGQTVSAGLATVATSSAPNPSQLNQAMTLTATVAPVAPATAVPTGSVEFFEGTTSLGTGTVDATGKATAVVSTLPVGAHSITSVFTSADPALYPNATSPAYSHTVNRATSTVAVTVQPAGPVHGETATLTATVTSLGGEPTGSVEFFDGATSLGTDSLSGGEASITAALSAGTRSLTAVYAGDANILPGTSPVNATVVGKAPTSTVVEEPTSESVFGAPVHFSAQVTAEEPGAGLPTGNVQFFVDGVASGNPVAVDGSGVAVSGGVATMSAGDHAITATYLGDTNFTTSTSDAVEQTVQQATSTFTITVNGSSSGTVTYGTKATLAVTGLPVGAAGTVTFSSPNDTNLCTITLPATSCLTSATLGVGSHSPVGAAYINTDGNYTGSASSNSATLTVNALKPGKPTAVHASLLSGGRVKVTWTAPANNTGTAVTGYTVTASPGGKTVSVSGSATQATITGLAARKYTFKVRATNIAGTGAQSGASNAVTIASTAKQGYWMLGQTGRVYGFGNAAHLGNASGNAVAMANRRDGKGYWVATAVGHVFNFGTAKNHGGRPALRAGELVSTISATPSGNGYWLFTNRGRTFAFGDAKFYGDMSAVALNGPVIASVATPTGKGYYMVGSDGGVFTFGDAKFHGSTGAIKLNQPIVGMSPTPDNKGYWLVASDGGVFAFGAPFRGSMGHAKLNQPVNGLVAFGNGYLMVASDGGVFNFSNKPFFGSLAATPPSAPIIGISAFATM